MCEELEFGDRVAIDGAIGFLYHVLNNKPLLHWMSNSQKQQNT